MKTNKLGIKDSINYLVQGIKIALSKECRSYVIIPILINLVLLSTLGYLSYSALRAYLWVKFKKQCTIKPLFMLLLNHYHPY